MRKLEKVMGKWRRLVVWTSDGESLGNVLSGVRVLRSDFD